MLDLCELMLCNRAFGSALFVLLYQGCEKCIELEPDGEIHHIDRDRLFCWLAALDMLMKHVLSSRIS